MGWTKGKPRPSRRLTPETRAKISFSMREFWASERSAAQRETVRKPRGPHTPETRAKISAAVRRSITKNLAGDKA